MAAVTTRVEKTAFFCLLLGASLIGFAPLFVRISTLGPAATAFWRLFLALPVFVLGMLWIQHGRGEAHAPFSWRALLPGAFFAGDMLLWNWAIAYTSIANATLFTNLAPIFVTFAAWLFFRERVSFWFLVALALAIGGCVLVMRPGTPSGNHALVGDILAVCSAVFYGSYQLSSSRLRRRFSTPWLMALTSLSGAAVTGVTTFLTGEPFVNSACFTPQGAGVLLALSWFSHVGGQGLIVYALAHLPAGFSSVSLLLQPVVAAAAAWWLLGEPLHGLQIIGGVVVLCSIFLARQSSLAANAVAASHRAEDV